MPKKKVKKKEELPVEDKKEELPVEDKKEELPVEDKKEELSNKITKNDLLNFPPILPGQKDIRVTVDEVKELRDKGVLCGYDPKSGVARVKG